MRVTFVTFLSLLSVCARACAQCGVRGRSVRLSRPISTSERTGACVWPSLP